MHFIKSKTFIKPKTMKTTSKNTSVFKLLKYSVSSPIATITINKIEKRNSLCFQLISELTLLLDIFESDLSIKAIIFKSTGHVFCAGMDLNLLKAFQQNNLQQNEECFESISNFFKKIQQYPKITIAQIEGHAFGAGVLLAGVCDFAYSTAESCFCLPEVKIGIVPAMVVAFLKNRVSDNILKRLLITGEKISATKALQINMIDDIIESTQIEFEVNSIAHLLCKEASLTYISSMKTVMNEYANMNIDECIDNSVMVNAQGVMSEECATKMSIL